MKAFTGILAVLFVGVVLSIYFAFGFSHRAPNAAWDGQSWSCPAGYSVYASEDEALAGKASFVHCVK